VIDINGKNTEEETGRKMMFLFSRSRCFEFWNGRNFLNITDGFKDIQIKEI